MQDKEIINLVKKAKRHDSDAFTELMQLYMKDMYRTAIAILMNDDDAADAIQDTILICWEKLWTLREIKLFKTWMTRILINKCYDIRKRYENIVEIEVYEEPAVNDEYNLELKEALSALDEKYRIPMTLFYGQGYKCDEIAEILHIPKSTVQTRLARGRERLARYYEEGKE
ncbi:MAG: RNA polymerase sigma factor [Lachnospiraceae bacterium]|nr:RNA polymerase sigma factor [Lachnospiraceae bacterium]